MAENDELRELFAPEPPTPEPAPAPEPPAPGQTPSPSPAPGPEGESIPPWRLREESEARRLAEENARVLKARLDEIESRQRQQTKPEKDIFEDPNGVVQEIIQQTLGSHLAPVLQNIQRTQMALSRNVAESRHGEEALAKAEEAFLAAVDNKSLDVMEFESVVQSPNRYDAVVQWHKRHTTLAAVGTDPEAWFNKQLEAKLADPKFLGALIERSRGGSAAVPSVTRLPPTLSRTPASAASAAGGGDEGPMTDENLFRSAMS